MHTHDPGPRRRHQLSMALLVALTAAVLPTAAQATPTTSADVHAASAGHKHHHKPRVILTTDGEVDDMDSFIRYLYYSNEFDTAGIVLTSSRFHWAGNRDTVAPYRWTGDQWVNDYIDRYAKVYPTLHKHTDGYPTPARLRSLYKIGNIDDVSDWSFAYQWKRAVPEPFQYTLRAPYMEKNFLSGHGPLLERYRTYRDGNPTPGDDENNRWRPESSSANQNSGYDVHDFISEGDSPAFLHLLDFNRPRSSEDPAYGGWGGRFTPNASGWIDTSDANPYTGNAADRKYPQTRWVDDIQNDFAVRATWGSTRSYADANHNPTASVKPGTDLTAGPGAEITLRGSATDPDGDRVSYKWWQYTDADTYPGKVALTGTDTRNVSFTVPADAAPGSTIHIILEAKDNGTPALKHYQRLVVTVSKK
ncbi:nucleoside hydrolase-like domain-containing protein [Streptomyces sp. NPDC004752]